MANTLELLNSINVQFALNPPAFSGYQTTTQSIPSSVWTPLSIDTTYFDNYTGHSNSTNNSRYTAQVAGWYTVSGAYVATLNNSGNRGARIQVNGNPVTGVASFLAAAANTNATAVPTPTSDVHLNVGDYVEVAGWQNTGSALNTGNFTDVASTLWVRFSHF